VAQMETLMMMMRRRKTHMSRKIGETSMSQSGSQLTGWSVSMYVLQSPIRLWHWSHLSGTAVNA
jgi:hypothetical protein